MTQAAFEKLPLWRVIPTRHPPIALFERAASPEDVEENLRLEAAFNAHHGEFLAPALPPRSQWVVGPGAGYIMAPFTYPNPSRFSDGTFGVFYGGLEEATAILEVAFHRGRFMAATALGPMVLEHLILTATCTGSLEDLRASAPHLHDPDHYEASQAFGRSLKEEDRDGLLYDSVCAPGGACAGLFKPRTLRDCRASRPLSYFWDGTRISAWATPAPGAGPR